MKRILLFYSNTGGSHLRAAQAIAEHLKKLNKNLRISLVDGLTVNNFGKKNHPEKIFLLFLTKLLFLYNLLYILLNNKFGVWLLRTIIKLNWKKALEREVSEFNPNLIVTTHPAITPSIFSNLKMPFVIACLDLGKPHLLWFDKNADKIIVADTEVAKAAYKIIDQGKIAILDYPLRADFQAPKSSKKISNNILILGGGAGVGNIKDQALSLPKIFPDKKFIVVCGFNKKLEDYLKSKNLPNLEVTGFRDDLPKLMRLSDIILTKAGPTSLVEAAILKTPIIVTGWTGMQEKGNIDFVIKNNLGIFCPEVSKLPDAIRRIYQDYKSFAHGELELVNGSERIARFLLGLM